MNKIWVYIKSITIPVIIGAIVGYVTMNFMDYSELNQPPLAPPGWLFPVVWTILYILMGVSYAMLKIDGLMDDELDSIYYLQLGVNALWSIFFFILKWRFFAFLWIILLLVLVLKMIKLFYDRNRVAGLLQIPYLVWLVFAAYLNLGVYILNR